MYSLYGVRVVDAGASSVRVRRPGTCQQLHLWQTGSWHAQADYLLYRFIVFFHVVTYDY